MLYAVAHNMHFLFICTKVIQRYPFKYQHMIKHTTLSYIQWKCILFPLINYYTLHVCVESVCECCVKPALSAALPRREQRGQPLFLCLSFAVIIFTRQLGDRPRFFDVTVSLVVHWAAAWSALILATERRLKRVKQKLDKAIVCSINRRTSFALLESLLTGFWSIRCPRCIRRPRCNVVEIYLCKKVQQPRQTETLLGNTIVT